MAGEQDQDALTTQPIDVPRGGIPDGVALGALLAVASSLRLTMELRLLAAGAEGGRVVVRGGAVVAAQTGGLSGVAALLELDAGPCGRLMVRGLGDAAESLPSVALPWEGLLRFREADREVAIRLLSAGGGDLCAPSVRDSSGARGPTGEYDIAWEGDHVDAHRRSSGSSSLAPPPVLRLAPGDGAVPSPTREMPLTFSAQARATLEVPRRESVRDEPVRDEPVRDEPVRDEPVRDAQGGDVDGEREDGDAMDGDDLHIPMELQSDFESLYREALQAYRDGHYDNALRLLEACLELRPRDKRVASNMNVIRAKWGAR